MLVSFLFKEQSVCFCLYILQCMSHLITRALLQLELTVAVPAVIPWNNMWQSLPSDTWYSGHSCQVAVLCPGALLWLVESFFYNLYLLTPACSIFLSVTEMFTGPMRGCWMFERHGNKTNLKKNGWCTLDDFKACGSWTRGDEQRKNKPWYLSDFDVCSTFNDWSVSVKSLVWATAIARLHFWSTASDNKTHVHAYTHTPTYPL